LLHRMTSSLVDDIQAIGKMSVAILFQQLSMLRRSAQGS